MITIRQRIKVLIQRATGLNFYRTIPFGVDPFNDIIADFKDYSFKTFFDVGANIGQTAQKIKYYFPEADIWCFEPVSKTFETLKLNTENTNINCFRIGLGARNEEKKILIHKDNSFSEMNSIVNPKQEKQENLIEEIINLIPLDSFCHLQKIEKIDYLKIDTEGYDLEVLKGSSEMLKKHSILFIEVEASMNPDNQYHVCFEKIKKYLEKFDYRLYGIYDQVHEWITHEPILRRVNPLFVSKAICKEIPVIKSSEMRSNAFTPIQEQVILDQLNN